MSGNLTPFPCTSCGECCRRVYLSSETESLDRGDGVCKYFNDNANICLNYENRPLICRVEDYYKQNLKDTVSWEYFVMINLEVCRDFQKNK